MQRIQDLGILATMLLGVMGLLIVFGPVSPSPAQQPPLPTSVVYLPLVIKIAPVARIIEPNEPWNPAKIEASLDPDWYITNVKLLDPCENHNMGIGFILALDANGEPVDMLQVDYANPPYRFSVITGSKGPGRAEFTMLGEGNYFVWAQSRFHQDVSSDLAYNLETYNTAWQLPDYYRICAETGLEGNAPKHLGYAVTFQHK